MEPGAGFSFPAQTRTGLEKSAIEAVHFQGRAGETRGYTVLAKQKLLARALNTAYTADLPSLVAAHG